MVPKGAKIFQKLKVQKGTKGTNRFKKVRKGTKRNKKGTERYKMVQKDTKYLQLLWYINFPFSIMLKIFVMESSKYYFLGHSLAQESQVCLCRYV